MTKHEQYRKHIRLRNYDYGQNGHYFVTICTNNWRPLFVSDDSKALILSKLDQIPRFFPGVSVDIAVVMPNHLHMVLVFEGSNKPLGQVIQVFKSWVTRELGGTGSVWQPNYYEHILRNEAALHRIRKYIQNNPLVNQVDCEQFYSE